MPPELPVSPIITLVLAPIVTLLTLVVGFYWQAYRESRNRRWDHEDRERARKEQLDAAAARTLATVVAINGSTDAIHRSNSAKDIMAQQELRWQAQLDALSARVDARP
jgi:hypothetical protein